MVVETVSGSGLVTDIGIGTWEHVGFISLKQDEVVIVTRLWAGL
jgi:hypothetical protein